LAKLPAFTGAGGEREALTPDQSARQADQDWGGGGLRRCLHLSPSWTVVWPNRPWR